MRNKYEIRGDVTVIFLEGVNGRTTTTISTQFLPVVDAIAGSWYAMNVGGKDKEKIYVGTVIGGVTIYMHTLLVVPPPNHVVDHINHNSLDNTWRNLRVVTVAQNGQNRKGAQSNNKSSGMRNVYKNQSGNWFVRLMKEGESIHLGTFKTKDEAAKVAEAGRKYYFNI